MANDEKCKDVFPRPLAETHGSRVYNLGNPVFTYSTEKAPIRQMPSSAPLCESADVLYRTTSADYGRRDPTVHTAPSTYWPRTNKFSDHLGQCGMYRNRSLNCSIDRCTMQN